MSDINTKKCVSFRFKLKKKSSLWYDLQPHQPKCQTDNDKGFDNCCGINWNNVDTKCIFRDDGPVSLSYCSIGSEYFYSYAMLETRKNACAVGSVTTFNVPSKETFCAPPRLIVYYGFDGEDVYDGEYKNKSGRCKIFQHNTWNETLTHNTWLTHSVEHHERWLGILNSD